MMNSSKIIGCLGRMAAGYRKAIWSESRLTASPIARVDESKRGAASVQSLQEEPHDDWQFRFRRKWLLLPVAGVGTVIGFSALYLKTDGFNRSPSTEVCTESPTALAPTRPGTSGDTVPGTDQAPPDGLPEYGWSDVAQHKTLEDGIWVTFDGNVYDITEFVEGHPGGEKIMLAAGGPIEPFWDIYTIHRTEEVKELLETMLIGRLRKSEAAALEVTRPRPYQDDPQRHPGLILNSQMPFDAETPPEMLVDHFKTPNDIFYVRNHLPVPNIKGNDYTMSIEIPGAENVTLTLEDLKKFKKTTIVATMQCAGNRRKDMNQHKKIYGANGGHTAISNAEWGGVLLRDVLLNLGFDENNAEVQHIQFEGYDKDIAGEHYGASVPVDIAMRPGGDVLLAYEMNGEPLPRDHGFPVRVVIPGVVGARSVKWLKSIRASKHESASFFQKKDYRTTPPSADWNTFDFYSSDAHAIYSSPVQSAICDPPEGATIAAVCSDDAITVRGYAFSGGGNGILRVDVSADGGDTWQSAELLPGVKQTYHKNWAWRLWEARLTLPPSLLRPGGSLTLCCKATDTFHNVQPENVSGIWNLRGFLNNSWHRVTLNVKDNQD